MNNRQSGRQTVFSILVGVAFAGLLAAVPLLPTLADPDLVLRFNDSSLAFALSPFARLRTALLCYWDPQSFFGLGNRQATAGVFTGLDAVVGPVAFRRWGPPLLLAAAAGAVFWMLRAFGWRRRACGFAAGVFLLSGAAFTYAVCGLGVRPIAMGFNALAIGFIERGRRARSWIPYAVAGVCVGCGISEVADVGAFLALATAFVLVWTHLAEAPLRRAAVRTAVALTLVAAAAVPASWQMLATMADTQMREIAPAAPDDPQARFNWATQWSIPPAESWAIVAGSFFGSTSDSAATPYWGRMGRSADWERTREGFRNFSLTGWHLGAIPAALLLALLPLAALPGSAGRSWRDRHRAWMLGVGMLGALVLAWGRYTPLYRTVLALPFFDTVRNPEKWMIPFALFASMGVALGMDRILAALERDDDGSARVLRATRGAVLVLLGIAVLVAGVTVGGRADFLSARVAEGFADAAPDLHRHALAVTVRALAVLAGAWILLRLTALRRRPGAVFAGLSILSAAHLLGIAGEYVQTEPVRPTVAPNALTETLDAVRGQGRLKLLPPPGAPELAVLLNQFRLTFLMARGYDLFDPISVSRMPGDYAALIDALRDSPFRLWELGAIRFVLTAPGAAGVLDAADGRRGRFVERTAFGLDTLDGRAIPVERAASGPDPVRLVEFSGASPMLHPVRRIHAVGDDAPGNTAALVRLAEPDFHPDREAVVHGADALPAMFDVGQTVRLVRADPVRWEAEMALSESDSFLVRSVRFDRHWTAAADGVPLPLYRVNYLFQGVHVPAGSRRVTFAYRPPMFPLVLSAGVRILTLGWGLGWAWRRRRVPIPSAGMGDGS